MCHYEYLRKTYEIMKKSATAGLEPPIIFIVASVACIAPPLVAVFSIAFILLFLNTVPSLILSVAFELTSINDFSMFSFALELPSITIFLKLASVLLATLNRKSLKFSPLRTF